MKNTIDFFIGEFSIKDLTPVDLQAITAIKEYIETNPLTKMLPFVSKGIEADLVSLGILPKGSSLSVKKELTEADYSLPQFEFSPSTPFLTYVNRIGSFQWGLGERSHLLVICEESRPLTLSPLQEMVLLAEVSDPEDSLVLFNEIKERESELKGMLKSIHDYFYSIAGKWVDKLDKLDELEVTD